jgi:hypothetical protein
MLCEILEFLIPKSNFHELNYLSRFLCKSSIQLLRFKYFKKQCRSLTLIDKTFPKLDYGYRYDITVSEALLLKLPP